MYLVYKHEEGASLASKTLSVLPIAILCQNNMHMFNGMIKCNEIKATMGKF